MRYRPENTVKPYLDEKTDVRQACPTANTRFRAGRHGLPGPAPAHLAKKLATLAGTGRMLMITRIFTDVPPDDLAMMANAIAVDNGTFTQQTQEDGNLTLFAEFRGIRRRNNTRVPALSSSRGCPSRATKSALRRAKAIRGSANTLRPRPSARSRVLCRGVLHSSTSALHATELPAQIPPWRGHGCPRDRMPPVSCRGALSCSRVAARHWGTSAFMSVTMGRARSACSAAISTIR